MNVIQTVFIMVAFAASKSFQDRVSNLIYFFGSSPKSMNMSMNMICHMYSML